MEIKKMNLQGLRNEEHFQFMTDAKELIQTAGLQALNVDPFITSFMDVYGKEEQAIEVIRKNALTDPISDADAHRDAVYYGFSAFVKAFRNSPEQDKTQAAHNIQVVIDHYGDFRSKPYNEETASIYNLLQDINTRCINDVAALNAGGLINELSVANQTFNGLMNQRFDGNAGQEMQAFREIRKEIDAAYTALIDRINAFTLLNGNAISGNFIMSINERVVYFSNTLKIRKGRAAAKNEDTVLANSHEDVQVGENEENGL